MPFLNYPLNAEEKQIVVSLSVIPFSMFSFPELFEMFNTREEEKSAFFDTVHDLSTRGILIRKSGLYGILPETAAKIIEREKPDFEDCSRIIYFYISKIDDNKNDPLKEFKKTFEKLEYLLHKIDKYSVHLAQLYYKLALVLQKFGEISKALEFNQKAIEISESIDGKHLLTALYYRNMAEVYKKMGNAKMAVICSLRDIEILEKNAGKYDEFLPGSFYKLSKTYEEIRDYDKAIEYNLKAIQSEENRIHPRFFNLSGLYHNLAFYYVKTNNLNKAAMFIDKAVESFNQCNMQSVKLSKRLLRDQKRFKSLLKLEKFVLKFRFPFLVALILAIIIFLLMK
ncbi:MAG: tetratricopeptide repeat protein [Bacteroidales bacterium]